MLAAQQHLPDQPAAARLAARIEARLRHKGRWRADITRAELAAHCTPASAWVAVGGQVYDITHHVQDHPGWTCGCAVSTLMATLRVLGSDCTEEFNGVHTARACAQLQPYLIGRLTREA